MSPSRDDARPPLLPLIVSHLARIESIRLEILSELDILLLDCILVNLRQQQDQTRAQNAKRARHEERVLAILDRIWRPTISLDDREHVGTNESANLAACSSNCIVLATDTSRAGLGRDQPNVVTRSHLAEHEEDAVDDDKGTDVLLHAQPVVAAAHDEADDGLRGHEGCERVLWAHPVGEKGAEDGSRDVEDVDQCGPTEGLPELRIWLDGLDPDRGVQREGVGREVVDEPDARDEQEAGAIKFEGQPVGCARLVEAFPGERLGFLELDPEVEEGKWRDDAEAKGKAPDETEVVRSDQGDNHGDDGANDETKIKLHVGEEDKPAIA